jgi:hypothetical protein
MSRGFERVLDVAFKRIGGIPPYQDDHEGRLRFDDTRKRLNIGTSSGWGEITIRGDGYRTAGNLPTIARDAGNMGASSTVSVAATSNSYSGRLTINTAGAGYGSGDYFSVTFASALDDANYDVFIQPVTDDAIALGFLRITSQTAGSFVMRGLAVPAVSKSYGWSYLVVPRE